MKNKLITVAIAAAIIGGGLAVPVFAQTSGTSTSSLQVLLQTLQQQVAALKAKLDTLNQAQTAVGQAKSDVVSTLKLIKNLKQGMSGDDVKLLQETLAADPSVYPDGLVTGYYGQLTAKAVRNFQKKHGISQTGGVGPQTMAQLNRELDDHPIIAVQNQQGQNQQGNEGNDENGNGHKNKNENGSNASTTHCAIVPPGHLIAPGWLRKQGGVAPIVPQCQTLPPGIAAKLGLKTSTPPAATSTLSIFGVSATNITVNSASITWTTNISAAAKAWYSTLLPVVATSTTPSVSSSVFATSRNLALSGLTSSTTYYYLVASTDASGNTVTAGPYSFTTATPAPALAISQISATSTTATSTNVVWTTNVPATSVVWYSTSTPVVATSTTPTVSSSALVTSHSLMISGLATSTTYHYLIASTDASNNTATSSEFSFTTLAQ